MAVATANIGEMPLPRMVAAHSGPPVLHVRGKSLSKRVAGVVGTLLVSTTVIVTLAASAAYQIREYYASEGRAEALVRLAMQSPVEQRLRELETGVKLYPGASVAILTSSGAVLARRGVDAGYPRPDVALAALAQAKGEEGPKFTFDLSTVDVARRLPGGGVGDESQFYVVARSPSPGLGWAGLFTSLLIVGAGIFASGAGYWIARAFTKKILRPLQRIAEAAHGLTVKNMTVNLDVSSGDELEALALAFNRMTRRLTLGLTGIKRNQRQDAIAPALNRDAFVEDVTRALATMDIAAQSPAVIVCNLVRFRHINEVAGQKIGNEVLATVARRFADVLESEVGDDLLLARLSGDEFGIFAPNLGSPQDAALLMQALINSLSAPVVADDQKFVLTVSAGAVSCEAGETDVERLIGRAQTALKNGRADGAGQGRIFVQDMDKSARDVFAAEAAIRDAIDSGHIIPYFQPKVDLTSGRITSAEALARWVVPGRGVIEPNRFIPAAENLGLISALGDAILLQSCKAAAAWQRQGLRCRVAVNVAPAQFDDPGFSDRVFEILAQTGLAPDLLELEITESTAMKNIPAAVKQISPLRKAGVRLSLDDFGAGHSSLAMLTQMPFDIFKIDRQFVSAIDTDEEAAAVVDTILNLGKALDFETVAEGVENIRQEAFLRKRGCTLGQGYLYGRPIPLAEFLTLAHAGGRSTLRRVA